MEDPTLKLGEGRKSIFLSTKGKNSGEISKELFSFLTFVKESKANETRDYRDAYVRQLQRSIVEVKHSRKMGERYMTLKIALRDQYRKGIAEGESRGRARSILDLLEELGPVPEFLRDRVMQENNQEVLKAMLKTAKYSESIEQFIEIYSSTS